MGQLEGRTAVVTGASAGIGLATAVRLAAEGAHVFITGRRKAELDAAVETIGPDAATAVAGDVADLDDLDRLYDAVRARGRGLDVVFANAAAASFATLEQITEEHFDRTFGVNVRGTVFTVRKALPLLNDGASVILMSSVRADDGVEAFGTYAASKAAIRSYARTWANELKGRNIRVNAISPGTIDTPGLDAVADTSGASGTSDASDASDASVIKSRFAAGVPLGRIGRPEEVANAVAFLASGESSFFLGANLYVDGGENQI
ncbi:SDR family NAD(P)-dependent oxidoreductase [Streptomyces tsukubensis]|uniref:Short-chain dehydrogenase n=1 Tax=Streptomyces tsukubensis TaxID=83656 RepID=A0A1V4AFR7_9ACTN|nr:SDR family oxidoreductase [Streptomyces tsukubensis]OON82209.1 short-chain dehydrogenase [Streptomyces tsukubensis]QFR92696.1 SDR family oxidoreductase [Streptomyces tsukubensis]